MSEFSKVGITTFRTMGLWRYIINSAGQISISKAAMGGSGDIKLQRLGGPLEGYNPARVRIPDIKLV